MLSFYSMLARKPWGHPENMKGTMGVHQKFRALRPTFLTDRADHWSLLFADREASRPQPVCYCWHFLPHFALNTFSFSDAKRARNRLRWIGKTRKMAGTSGNSFSGSYRVQLQFEVPTASVQLSTHYFRSLVFSGVGRNSSSETSVTCQIAEIVENHCQSKT